MSQNTIGGKIKLGSIGLPAKHSSPTQKFSEIVVRSPVLMKEYFPGCKGHHGAA